MATNFLTKLFGSRNDRLLKQYRKTVERINGLEAQFEKLDDDARAGEHYARAAKLAPESGHVLNVYGAWLCEKGRTAEAEAVFTRAVKDPFYKARDQAYFNAGKCAMRAGAWPSKPRTNPASSTRCC